MENRDRDKVKKNIDTNKQDDSEMSFGKNIGKSEHLQSEPSRRSGSLGSQQGSKGSKGSIGSSGSSGSE